MRSLSLYVLILLSFLLPLPCTSEQLQFSPNGGAVLLINADSGAVLFEHNAHTLYYPASVTKIATAIYALQLLQATALTDTITVDIKSLRTATQAEKRRMPNAIPRYCLEPDGSHIGIKAGEILSWQTLLEGLLIPSGNDAANVIAEALGPTIPQFLIGLNDHLAKLGCKQTNFCNPHGLHDPEHQSTAHDLAIMGKAALKHPVLCEIMTKTRFLRPKTNKQAAASYMQTNRLLRPGALYYDKACGMKTGHHAKAKHTFMGAARNHGRTLIAVLLDYQERSAMFQDAKLLFEAAFNQPKVQSAFLPKGIQTFKYHLANAQEPIEANLKEALTLEFYPAEDPHAKCLVHWAPVQLPVAQDQKIGEIHLVSNEGNILKSMPLWSAQAVDATWTHRLSLWLTNLSMKVIVLIYIAISGLLLLLWLKNKK